MAPGRKTGGRIKGSRNKPKALFLAPTDENRALMAMAPTAEVRTPKAVMLAAMLKFERMSDVLMAKAERMTDEKSPFEEIKQVVTESHKFTLAAVACAEKAAPYVHARYLAIETRTEEKAAPFVIRAPAVAMDSSSWQATVGSEIMDMEAAQMPMARSNEVAIPEPQTPQTAPAPSAVVLTTDPKTNKITVMPPGPRVVQPNGSQEWLESIKRVG